VTERPSDPGIERPGDPVTQFHVWCVCMCVRPWCRRRASAGVTVDAADTSDHDVSVNCLDNGFVREMSPSSAIKQQHQPATNDVLVIAIYSSCRLDSSHNY